MLDNDFFQILLIIFVALWTARTARNKGRNALLWGALALIPAVGLADGVPTGVTALSMVPMLGLVFIPSRRTTADGEQQKNALNCPRCQHAHESATSFCTNCGWELAKPYASVDATATAAPPASTSADAPLASAAAAETARDDAAAAPAAAIIPEPTLAATQTEPPPTSSEASDTAAGSVAASSPAGVPGGFSAEPLTITRPLTAAAMTERGLSLFNQGRVREAVDQFTKAIALDPRYREAWSSRAKAYTDLGLSDKAAADRQQLEAI